MIYVLTAKLICGTYIKGSRNTFTMDELRERPVASIKTFYEAHSEAKVQVPSIFVSHMHVLVCFIIIGVVL